MSVSFNSRGGEIPDHHYSFRNERRRPGFNSEERVSKILHKRLRDDSPKRGRVLRPAKPPSKSYKRFLQTEKSEKKVRRMEKKEPVAVFPSKEKLPRDFRLTESIASKLVLKILKCQVQELDEAPFESISQSFLDGIESSRLPIKKNGLPTNLTICRIDDVVGEGVFLKREANPLNPGDFIGLYAGEYKIMSLEEREEHDGAYSFDLLEEVKLKPSHAEKFKTETGFEGETDDLHIIVDGKEKGNFTRNINGSERNANATAVFCQMPDGRVEVVIQAVKKIMPGNQILINYGKGYWKTLNVIPLKMTPRTYVLG